MRKDQSIRKPVGLAVLVLAYVLLIPGLTQPMLTVSGTVEKTKLVELGKQFIQETPTKLGLMGDMANMLLDNMKVEGTVDAFHKTRSILGTVQDLLDSGNALVAIMIVFFSVIVPAIKGLLTLATLLPLNQHYRNTLQWISSNMSKWSMADVFVIAIFIAFLAAKGIREDTGLVSFDAVVGAGFYYFLGYCLLSILSAQILYYEAKTPATKKTPKKAPRKTAKKNSGR